MPIDNITDQPNAAIPVSTWETTSLGPRELASFANTEVQPASTPPEPEEGFGSRLAAALEGFGAGYKGQEPLFLKLRRQKMLEDLQRQKQQTKLLQLAIEKQKRLDGIFDQGIKISMDDRAPIEARIAALDELSKEHPGLAVLKPLMTKQVLQDLPLAKDYLSKEALDAVAGIQRDPKAPIQFPGGLTGIATEIKDKAEYGRAVIKEKAGEIREAELGKRIDKDETLGPLEREFMTTRAKERMKRDEEYDQLVLAKRKLKADTAIAERPKTIDVQVGSKVMTLQETEVGSGKWEPITVGGKQASGEKKPLVQVDMGQKSSEVAAGEYMKKAGETYQQLKNVPTLLKNMAQAKDLVAGARGFMGTGGEALLGAAKFLNNRFGFRIDQKGIKNAEELQSRIFQNVMENLKKLDAQPSQLQQTIMMDALGRLGTDPNALPEMLNAYSDILRDKVATYNAEVQSAEKRGTKFPYDPTIKLPPVDYSPKLDFDPPQTWPKYDDKGKFEWLQREKKLSKHEATKYIAEH